MQHDNTDVIAARNGYDSVRHTYNPDAPRPNSMYKYGVRNAVIQSMGFPSYPDYLASSLWKGIRRRVMIACGWKCVLCGASATDAHHLKYNKATMLGKRLGAIVSLCRSCHKCIEFAPGGRKRDPDEVGQAFKGRVGNAKESMDRFDGRRFVGHQKRKTCTSCGRRLSAKKLKLCVHCRRVERTRPCSDGCGKTITSSNSRCPDCRRARKRNKQMGLSHGS